MRVSLVDRPNPGRVSRHVEHVMGMPVHRGQHLVDARTGRPVEGVASVTVIGPSLTCADIDATAAYVHGADAATWLSGRPGQSGLVVWPDATTTMIDGRPAATG